MNKPITFTRTVTTILNVDANVPSEVWIAGLKVGTTPLSIPFSYQEEVRRQTEKQNYWKTNPGTATAVTVLSLGAYIPFSFIQVEPTTESRALGKFVGNSVNLRVVAEGYEPLVHRVLCEGQETLELTLSLERIRTRERTRKEEQS